MPHSKRVVGLKPNVGCGPFYVRTKKDPKKDYKNKTNCQLVWPWWNKSKQIPINVGNASAKLFLYYDNKLYFMAKE